MAPDWKTTAWSIKKKIKKTQTRCSRHSSWQIKSIKTSLINETAVMVHQLKDAPGECF